MSPSVSPRRLDPASALGTAVAAALFAAAISAVPLAAQMLQGTVRIAGSDTPAAGVILTASTVSGDSVLARTLTASSGSYLLRLPAEPVRIRALRIGHRPTDLGVLTLAADERRTRDFVLEPAPVILAEVRRTARDECRLAPQAGASVIALFDEVQKALLASRLASQDGRPTVEFATVRRLLDRRGNNLAPPIRRVARGTSARPFRAITAETLAARGYVVEESDGTVFHAPDADVLLSDLFFQSHCLQIAADHPQRKDWLGLGFKPNRPPTAIVDIEGTLWVDRATGELRRLEYFYVGFPRRSVLESAGLGGSVDFTVLDDGWWFEDRWEIRMPRLSSLNPTAEIQSGRGGRMVGLQAIETVGGEVISLSRGDRLLYAGNNLSFESDGAAGVAEPLMDDDALGVALGDGCDATINGEPSATLFGTVYERPPERSPTATVKVSWREQFSMPIPHQFKWVNREISTTSASDGFYAICGIPRARLLQVQARKDSRESAKISARIDWETARQRLDLRFAEPLPPETAALRALRVRVTTESGAAIPFAVVSANSGVARIADSLGYVVLPPPTTEVVQLRVRRIGFALRDTAVTIRRPTADRRADEIRVELNPLPGALAAVTVTATANTPLVRSGFYDRIARVQQGAFTAEFVTPEEIEQRNAVSVSALLRGRRGVSVSSSKEFPRPRSILLGRNGCPMTVLVDRQRINILLTPEGAVPIDDLVSGRSVAAIEIYASTANAPAELIPLTGNGSCGIVAIWTGAP